MDLTGSVGTSDLKMREKRGQKFDNIPCPDETKISLKKRLLKSLSRRGQSLGKQTDPSQTYKTILSLRARFVFREALIAFSRYCQTLSEKNCQHLNVFPRWLVIAGDVYPANAKHHDREQFFLSLLPREVRFTQTNTILVSSEARLLKKMVLSGFTHN